jgi:hypothetical protein
MVQVPAPSVVTVVPATAQVAGVSLLKLAARWTPRRSC